MPLAAHPPGGCGFAPRGHGAEFDQMAIEIAEEDNAPAAYDADLHVLRSPRLTATGDAGVLDTPENRVELFLADMKRVVKHLEALPAIVEVKRQRLVDLHRSERTHRAVVAESKYLCE